MIVREPVKDWHPKERTVPDWIHQLPETGGRS